MASPLPVGDQDVTAREHVRAVTRAAGSSFYWGMRILPEQRRDAMFAVYAFCREVDDIADGDDPPHAKRAHLERWRRDIDKLYTDDSPETAPPVLRALAKAIALYNLDKEDFLEIVAGMEMDTDTSMVVPNCKRLQLYCDRVAGAVGLLSIKIFGVSDASARTFALRLGTALQLTNILRDLKDDARMGRLYLPREQFDLHGVPIRTPDEMIAHPKLSEICASVAERARQKFYRGRCPVRAHRCPRAQTGHRYDDALPTHPRPPDRKALAKPRRRCRPLKAGEVMDYLALWCDVTDIRPCPM